MKRLAFCSFVCGAAITAQAELARLSLDGTWDFAFARDAAGVG